MQRGGDRRCCRVEQRQILALTGQRIERKRAITAEHPLTFRLGKGWCKGLQPLQRLLRRRTVDHEPFLINALAGQGDDRFFFGQKMLRQRLEL